MDIKEAFEILELNEDDTIDNIKQHYRDLSYIWHPDRFPNNKRLKEKTTERLKKINMAFEIVKAYCDSKNEKKKRSSFPKIIITCKYCNTKNRVPKNNYYIVNAICGKCRLHLRSFEDFHLEAIILMRTKNYKKAILEFDKCIILDPKNLPSWYYKIRCLIMLKKYKKALKLLKTIENTTEFENASQSIDRFPTKDCFSLQKAYIYALQQDCDSAAKIFLNRIEVNKYPFEIEEDVCPYDEMQFLLPIGDCLLKLKNYDLAIETFIRPTMYIETIEGYRAVIERLHECANNKNPLVKKAFEKTLESIEKLIEFEYNEILYAMKGLLLASMGFMKNAKECLKECRDLAIYTRSFDYEECKDFSDFNEINSRCLHPT
jgi:tetratricopeptide (TPR) repeat protein